MATAASPLTEIIMLLPGYDPYALAGDCWFDEEAAAYAIEFIETVIKHAKGKRAGKSFHLEDWQRAIVANIFGWKRPDGTRRYREVLIYVAKKNGKTALCAAILLYVMVCDHELGAELYSAAASREQAALLFQHVVGMIKQDEDLSKLLKIYGGKGGSQQRTVTNESEMSAYKCLSADANTADGTSPHFAAIDELHRHKTPELADVLQKSTAARSQPLVIYTTTADYNRPSLCNSKLKYAKEVRDNKGDPAKPGNDGAFLPAVYETDPKCDWRDPENWKASNPNLGVTVPLDFLQRECTKAIETPSELNNFLRLHLNIVTDADEAWLQKTDWNDCCPDVDPVVWRAERLRSMRGKTCTVAVDLSSTNDLTALVLYFPSDGHVVLPFFWMPKDNAVQREREHRVPYSTWHRQGFLEMTDGNWVDHDFVIAQAIEAAKDYGVRVIGVDPWMSKQFTKALQDQGMEPFTCGQGIKEMSEPSKRLEKLVLSGELQHGNNPVLSWMAGNVMIHRDAAGNIHPDKSKSAEKIDGIVALIMGIRMAMEVIDDGPSIYETRGMITTGEPDADIPMDETSVKIREAEREMYKEPAFRPSPYPMC